MVFFLVLYELTVQKIKPATANISITYRGKVLAEDAIQVAQYGVAIPLALELFNGKTPIIRINPETGNILSIQK